MLVLAIASWTLVGIIFALLGRSLASGLIGLASFLVLGVAGALAGGLIATSFADPFGSGLLGAVLGALVGVALVGATAEIRTKGPTISS